LTEIEQKTEDFDLDEIFEEDGTVSLPVMPLRNTVLFPQQVIPIYIGRERSLALIDKLPEDDKYIGVVAQKEGSVEEPVSDDLYQFGTVAQVLKVFDMPDGSKSAIVQGLHRITVEEWLADDPFFRAVVKRVDEDYDKEDIEIDALQSNLRNIYNDLIKLAPYLTDEHQSMLSNIQHPARLVDRAVGNLNIGNAEKQEILEELNVHERLEKATMLINREIQRLELGEKIQSEVQGEISKTQREYYLREQLKAIKKELGEDDQTIEIKELEEKIQKAELPEEAKKVAEKELRRLEKIPPSSPEYTVSRTYLDWIVELPWSNASDDTMDVTRAKDILDEDHYGLDKVKTRILEYLAVRKLKRDKEGESTIRGPILCFVGPPGVGKTSVGKSIARAMGREFVRISLGGVRDEAEIRGHRRTYIGSLPGRIIQSLKKAGTNNPIFMLDEIDKLGSDFRGDPASALLEVLDPEQNHSFSDHYLEIEFDLSNVMFIATANLADPIPPALKDRMEMIEFPGYVEEEKLHIAKEYLVPKQFTEHGLDDEEIIVSDEALRELMHSYTREAGVRNLEREIANVLRKVARDIVEGKDGTIEIGKKEIKDYLGAQKFFSEVAERMTKPGIAIGLAWTAAGGDILFIEATKMPGKGELKLTGKLGDVMKESAQAALSYVRSMADEWGIDSTDFEKTDIHVHVPAGAIPKDGPSAGVTMLTAMVSLFTERMVKNNLGMTGEITLRGNVLPVGGIKEKVVAAHRSGLKNVILPERNKKDLEEIPEIVEKEMKFHFVKEMSDVIDLALQSPPKKKDKAA
jgi:ATP-dependent Lon protease